MPRIRLKPNSAEYADPKIASRRSTKHCDMPGCEAHGEHRAPKNRDLNDYYWFCQDHAREYNRAWNYFEGMSSDQVESHIINSLHGDRPTRRYDHGKFTDALHRKAWQTYNFTDEEPPRHAGSQQSAVNKNTPEHEALTIMGLEAPVTLETIKDRYKKLAKKYHPDLNKGDKESEELLKAVNMAYTILRLAYRKFEELPAQS